MGHPPFWWSLRETNRWASPCAPIRIWCSVAFLPIPADSKAWSIGLLFHAAVDLGDGSRHVGAHRTVRIELQELLKSLPGILRFALSQQGVPQDDVHAGIGLF